MLTAKRRSGIPPRGSIPSSVRRGTRPVKGGGGGGGHAAIPSGVLFGVGRPGGGQGSTTAGEEWRPPKEGFGRQGGGHEKTRRSWYDGVRQ